jgi:hypothetical protein
MDTGGIEVSEAITTCVCVGLDAFQRLVGDGTLMERSSQHYGVLPHF